MFVRASPPQVWVESTSVTKPFEVKHIEGEGMPVHNFPSQKGTLHVKIEVDFPSTLTQHQKDLVAKLFA
jgi:DnaJ-class molecular chaperone